MSDEKVLKSAYELAMERLRKGDADAGIERRPVTDAQKAAIAEIRNFYEAKLAEVEVLHTSRVRRPSSARATVNQASRNHALC